MAEFTKALDNLDKVSLSIALIGPDEQRRTAMVEALSGNQGVTIREYVSYPQSIKELSRLLEQHYDVVIIDADSDPDFAVRLAENLSAGGRAHVMAYSGDPDVRLGHPLYARGRARVLYFASQP